MKREDFFFFTKPGVPQGFTACLIWGKGGSGPEIFLNLRLKSATKTNQFQAKGNKAIRVTENKSLKKKLF